MCRVENLDNLPHPTSEGKFSPQTTKAVQDDVFTLVLNLFGVKIYKGGTKKPLEKVSIKELGTGWEKHKPTK